MYSSAGTFEALGVDGHRANVVKALEPFQCGEFDILPFDVQHDASEPLGFLIQSRLTKEKLVFAMDTYYIKYKFSGVTCYMIEANYQESILQKRVEDGRIHPAQAARTRRSHFEIDRCIDFLKASDLTRAKKIILLHLSDGNSNAEEFERRCFEATGVKTTTDEPKTITI